jgi:hypothetical protein
VVIIFVIFSFRLTQNKWWLLLYFFVFL